jgi:hypothetical protein
MILLFNEPPQFIDGKFFVLFAYAQITAAVCGVKVVLAVEIDNNAVLARDFLF